VARQANMRLSEAADHGCEGVDGMTQKFWISWFAGAKDPRIRDHVLLDWDTLKRVFTIHLDEFGPPPGDSEESKKIALDAKLNCTAFSPARWYEPAKTQDRAGWPTRATANVERVGMLVLDYDDGVTFEGVWDAWDGFARAAYTSWNSTPERQRMRLILPLAETIPAHQWGLVYRHMLAIDGKKADPKDCNADRIFFLPAIGIGGPHQARACDGARLSVYHLANRLEQEEREAEEARKRRNAAKIAEINARLAKGEGGDRERQRLLNTDPALRESLGLQSGGRLVPGAVPAIRGATCPACGQNAVWWAVTSGNARCNHQNSCGWSGRVAEYARLMGVR
jgi:hypothetical protein